MKGSTVNRVRKVSRKHADIFGKPGGTPRRKPQPVKVHRGDLPNPTPIKRQPDSAVVGGRRWGKGQFMKRVFGRRKTG
jgi:hypothetical protein